MSKKIDRLFSDKLNQWESPPGAEVWQQLENKLLTRKRKVLYWRLSIAASILLLFSIGYIFWNITSPQTDITIAETQPNVSSSNNVPTPIVIQQTPKSEENGSVPAKKITDKAPVKKSVVIKSENNKVMKKVLPMEEKASEELGIEEPLISEVNHQTPMISTEEVKEDVKRKLPPITIEYRSGSSVAIKAEVDTSKTEPRGLIRKIQSIAKDVRESDIGIGSLRQAKDEFLAFDKKGVKTEELNNY